MKFFGKIRQKFLSENKLLKYLIYAIGEILLVVVGILIALQINNWSEDQKKLEQQIIILQNIQEDILTDTLDISLNIRVHQTFLKEERALYNFINNNLTEPLNPIDYSNAMGSPLFSIIHQSSFSNLQSNDLGIITNNTLKKQIFRHYDFFVKLILYLENDFAEYRTYPQKKPYFLSYFEVVDTTRVLSNEDMNNEEYYNPNFERKELKISDLNGLKKDKAFKIILSESIFSRNAKIQYYEDFLNRINILNQAIKEELEVLSQQYLRSN